jgi:hypothetical protein
MKAFKDKNVINKMEKAEREMDEAQKNLKNRINLGDIPVYDDVLEVSQSEFLIIEKKLCLFSDRRKEEQESRAEKRKNNAKVRAIQELQARDPSNFTNQKRF